MSELMCVKKTKSNLNADQKALQRLKSKIESLQEKEKKQLSGLEDALSFYYENIRPEEEKLSKLLEEKIQLSYQIYKMKKSLSKRERRSFKELIFGDLGDLLRLSGVKGFSLTIDEISQELGWGSSREAISNELQEMVGDLEEMFSDQGVKVDLSGLDAQDGEEEILRKVFESIQAGMDAKEDPTVLKQKRSKESEMRQNIEEMQKKSINTIYKQLAKAFHPDLEQIVEKKHDKEELMKQLTVAYEKKDLYALLDLEMAWINSSSSAPKIESQEQLKIYNSILKDQMKALQERIRTLLFHPKYFPIQPFFYDEFTGMAPLLNIHRVMQEDVQNIRQFVQKLQGPQAEQMIKQILQQESMRRTFVRL